MIPLIDVSLVLLIFFMLTTNETSAAAGRTIPTPFAVYGAVVKPPDAVWVGIDLKGEDDDRTPSLFLGVGVRRQGRGDSNLPTRRRTCWTHLQSPPGEQGRTSI